jgi:small subunit ribosomal protein S8
MITDQTALFLTHIRNAGMSRNTKVDVIASKMNKALTEILVKEGYLKSSKEISLDGKAYLRLYLRYEGNDVRKPVISGIRRISTPGLRKYVNAGKIPAVLSGLGIAIISTSKGVLTDRDAKKLGVGGEHICSVW